MFCSATTLLLACSLATATTQSADSVILGEARSADGVAIRYEVRGTGEPTIVLVHGWTNSRAVWGEHPRTLARRHRVVALDLAGHGESGADRSAWTAAAFAEDVAAVVEQLGLKRVVLVGFSMGGGIVLQAAERIPDRVAGIVFVDTVKDPDTILAPEQITRMEAGFRAGWGDTAFVRAFAFTPDAPDSLIRLVVDQMPPQPREHWFAALHEFVAWERAHLAATLQRARAPIAAINTTMQPTNVAAIRRYVPSFTVDTLQGVGHAGILLQRVEDFDARLLAIVERFSSAAHR